MSANSSAAELLASLLVNEEPGPEHAQSQETLLRAFKEAGLTKSDYNKALFQLQDLRLVDSGKQVSTSYPSRNAADSMPPGVWNTPSPPPQPQRWRWIGIWPLPGLRDWYRSQLAANRNEAGTGGKSNPKLTTRQENVLETMLDKGAVDRDSRIPRPRIVESISPTDQASSYRRAFDGLADAGYTQGEPGAEGGIWLTPAGRDLAEEVKRRNDATKE